MSVAGAIYGKIDIASSGANTVRAAESDGDLVITGFGFVAAGAVDVTFKQGSTALTGAMSIAANGGIAVPHNPNGHFVIPKDAAFVITLGGAVQVSGWYTGFIRPVYS